MNKNAREKQLLEEAYSQVLGEQSESKAPKGASFDSEKNYKPSGVDAGSDGSGGRYRRIRINKPGRSKETHGGRGVQDEEDELEALIAAEDAEEGETFESYLSEIYEQQYANDPEQFENFIDDIHDALGQLKEYDLNRGSGLAEPVELGIEMGLDFDNAVERAQDSLKDITVSDVIKGRGK
jgi:hypothetical protein